MAEKTAVGTLLCVVLACAAAGCGGKAVDAAPPGASGGAAAYGPGPIPAGTSALPPGANPDAPLRGIPPPETCDDNPLLAGCRISAPAASPALAASPSAPPAANANVAAVVGVETVLGERCGSCHGGEPSVERCGTCDGLYYVENLRRLIQAGQVTPCSWQGSSLYQRIQDGSMPPPGSSATRLTSRELALVGNFVDGLCSALTDGGPEDAERAQIESWLGKDCGTCHGPAASPGAGSALSTLDGAGDVRELLEAGLIVPCDPEGSPLVQELRDTSMPPLGVSAHQPDRSMLRRLISFIARPCAR
jgi:hypothetical protein